MNRQRLDLVSVQFSKGFQDLDQKVQRLINVLSQEQKNFEELKDLIQNEHEMTRDHLSSIVREHEKRLAEQEYRTRLLESLWFPEILSREDTIADAHSKTFEWIFDRSGLAVRPWDNFMAWLESGERIYWISGKAGSGKSTLINFLSQDERTKEALTIWSGTKDILMPKFFFWSGGTTMQKSFEGLLRSLLWQILHECPDTNILKLDAGSRSKQNREISRNSNLTGAWTIRRLQRTLQEVIDELQSSYRFCFFIDGLDEFDENDDDLLAFVQKLVLSTGVKICLSSRPHNVFEDAFGSSSKLRLQDLTYKDIKRYVNDKFRAVPQLELMTSENEYDMDGLKKKIVRRSEGVFLWVSLAVKDQIRGLKNDDSPKQLQERLSCLPNEIEGIYLRMLLQIDEVYRQEASCFLQMAIYHPRLSILDHALASYKGLENMLSAADEVSKREVVSLCQSTRKKLITRCVGLLEFSKPSNLDTKSEASSEWISSLDSKQLNAGSGDAMSASNFETETIDDFACKQETEEPTPGLDKDGLISDSGPEVTDADALHSESYTIVDFVHRTAVDFLRESGPGKDFLESNLSLGFDPHVFYVKILLGRLRLLGHIWYHVEDKSDGIDYIMRLEAAAEERTGMPQIRMCDLIDHNMTSLDRSHSEWSPKSHWCTRWGKLARLVVQEQSRSGSRPKSSSRSSSRDSFHSATSEPIVPDCKAAPTGSINFLSFAASHSLSLYVDHVLNHREESVSPEMLDHLLYCCVPQDLGGSYESFHSQPFLNIVAGLLSRGANPNARFSGKTIWGAYLQFITQSWTNSLKFWGHHNSEPLGLATIAFIEHGADVGVLWKFQLGDDWLSNLVGCPFSGFSFHLQASALSLIEPYLRNQPEMPHIRKMCDDRGAVRYCRFTTLEFFHWSTEGKSLVRRFNLSEQESKDFLQILETGRARTKDEIPSLTQQLWALYTRLDKKYSASSSSSVTGTSAA